MKKLIKLTVVCAILFGFMPLRTLAQESVKLSFDHPTYYLNETARFHASVKNADGSAVGSRVLYVELVAPEGFVVKTQRYRLDKDGSCDGALSLESSLNSGYFSVCAYTRAMLNRGSAACFRQLIPLADKKGKIKWRHCNYFPYDEKDNNYSYVKRNQAVQMQVPEDIIFNPDSLVTLHLERGGSKNAVNVSGLPKTISAGKRITVQLHGVPNSTLAVSVTNGCEAKLHEDDIPECMISEKAATTYLNPLSLINREGLTQPQETGITVNGMLMTTSGNVSQPLPDRALTFRTLDIQGRILSEQQLRTDSRGVWSITLPDFSGTDRAEILPLDAKNIGNLCLTVDKWFSPTLYNQTRWLLYGGEAVLNHIDDHSSQVFLMEEAQECYLDFVRTNQWKVNANALVSGAIAFTKLINHHPHLRLIGERIGEQYKNDSIFKAFAFSWKDLHQTPLQKYPYRTDYAVIPSFATPGPIPDERGFSLVSGQYYKAETWNGWKANVDLLPYAQGEKPLLNQWNSPVRYTVVHGFTQPAPFSAAASPRTLYWNGAVKTDAEGNATITFTAPSDCKRPTVNVTSL